ncbi:MAG: response regulator [Candidatus Latescibacteria bacterium]|nr:response regulator [Candidatus Latescibacterota bacterium]
MTERKVLWVDDEIELLRPHIIFLEERGYSVTPVTNGEDAICLIKQQPFDVVLLDEMMPGSNGLAVLSKIREVDAGLPVVMVTKKEEEELMEEAIVKKATDFLTKPVNPSQVLSVCKRILEARQIREKRVAQEYASRATRVRSILSRPMDWRKWIDIYVEICQWDIEIEALRDSGLRQLHNDLKRECNVEFAKYIEQNYPLWLSGGDLPPLSVDVVPRFLAPILRDNRRVFFIVIDCMRLDHWFCLEPLLTEFFTINCDYYYSILPTATPYSRNAIFSGLFPSELARRYPDVWAMDKDDEQSLNRYEHQFLDDQLQKLGFHLRATKYVKVFDAIGAGDLTNRLPSFGSVPLVSMVFNFVDLLVHGRSKSEILYQIAPDEAGFRSLTKSWFTHSSLLDMLRNLARTDAVVVLTSDHGSVLSRRANIVYGDRHTSASLRYKYGNSLNCDSRGAILIRDPEEFNLPRFSPATNFILAKEDYFLVYPTRFHEHERRYRESFQHGGISLEEMILPVVVMESKHG